MKLKKMKKSLKIPIFESELEIIQKQDGEELQRLLFVILTWSKMYKSGEVYCQDRLIGKFAGVQGSKTKIWKILEDIITYDDETESSLIQVRYKPHNNTAYFVLFSEINSRNEPKFFIEINDVEDLIKCKDIFSLYFISGFHCSICGKHIGKMTNSHQKYCEECSKEVRRQYQVLKQREYRLKRKLEKMK